MPRYLLALDALRDLHARGVAGARVSGFGGRIAEALLACGSVAEAGDLAGPEELQQVATMFSQQGVALVTEVVS